MLVFSCELNCTKLSKILFCENVKPTFKSLKNLSELNSKKFTTKLIENAPSKNKPGNVVNFGSHSEKRLLKYANVCLTWNSSSLNFSKI